MTVQETLRELRETIGGDSPALDASLLTAARLGIRREQIYTEPDQPVPDSKLDELRRLARRRASGEPVAYLLGVKEFYGREFRIDRRVLVPRPDTEILVDAALEAIDKRLTGRCHPLRVLDLCCGSGCIGITLAAERPLVELVLADIDPDALELASENAAAILPPDRQPRCIVSDAFSEIGESFDIIVTNPPYVSEMEYGRLEMARWQEPRHALAAADNGLEVIRRIVDTLVGYVRSGGYFAVEAADSQADFLTELLTRSSPATIDQLRDYAGRRRVTTADFPG